MIFFPRSQHLGCVFRISCWGLKAVGLKAVGPEWANSHTIAWKDAIDIIVDEL
jgi:hypothetical protein